MSWAKCVVTGDLGKGGVALLPTKRNFHTCSVVGDSMYVIGGTDGVKFFDDANSGGVVWSLNIRNNDNLKWEEVKQTGVLKQNKFMGRSRHTAVTIGSVSSHRGYSSSNHRRRASPAPRRRHCRHCRHCHPRHHPKHRHLPPRRPWRRRPARR